jgi:predicted RND superfamily exporter protein
VTYDHNTFNEYTESELWLSEVQTDFQEATTVVAPIGIAIDFDQTFDEAIEASAPFIFLVVALIVLLVAIVHRSYWSAILVGTGLGVTMLAYNGVAALVGLKMGSLLLSFIVPIAMISSGVDFYIHGSGRVREMQADHGLNRRDAYPAGMRAVFLALLLAATSSIAAFLSNISSGTEAIIQFGVGAAIALSLAYVILGLIAPRALVGIEQTVGANPIKGRSKWAYGAAMFLVAIIAGLATTLGAVMPSIGAGVIGAVIVLFVLLPTWLTRRRNRKAVQKGRPVSDDIKGAAHGLVTVGSLVRTLAARRTITIPVVLVVGAFGLMTALQVESGFELKDFLSADTGVVQSLELYGTRFPSNGEGSSMVFIEGDLTQPATLEAIDRAVAQVDVSGADMGRFPGGELIVSPTATDIVRATMESEVAVDQIAERGVALTDSDGNGLADTPKQIAAIYAFVAEHGVLSPAGDVIYAPDDVGSFLFVRQD